MTVWALLVLFGHGEAPQAAFLDELARRAYDQRRFEEAHELFAEIQAVAPSIRNLYNVALSAELAGEKESAFLAWGRYLAEAAEESPDRRSAAEARRSALASELPLLEVWSTPPGARVFVDRVELGAYGVTPCTIPVRAGAHRLWLERTGHVTVQLPVRAERGAVRRVQTKLQHLQGHLRIDAEPSEATIEVLEAPEDERLQLRSGETATAAAGRHRIRATAPGHVTAEVTLEVRPGRTEVAVIALLPSPPPTGRLMISALEATADVWVDEVHHGQLPIRLELAEGVHAVELRQDGRARWRREVPIERGEATVLWARLDEPK